MWQIYFSRFLKSVFLITLEIRCLMVRSNYVRKYDTTTLRVGSSFSWHLSRTNWNNVTATFCFGLSLWHTFIMSQVRYLFVQRVTFSDDFRITLNYGSCWNVYIVYGSYVIKWSYFSWFFFVLPTNVLIIMIFLMMLR